MRKEPSRSIAAALSGAPSFPRVAGKAAPRSRCSCPNQSKTDRHPCWSDHDTLLDQPIAVNPGVTTASQCEPRPDRRRAYDRIRVAIRSRASSTWGRSRRRRSSGAPPTGAETNAIARAMPVGRPGLGEERPPTGLARPGVAAPRTSFALADRHELHVPWDGEHQLAFVWLISQR
jgi:hypothetical protein